MSHEVLSPQQFYHGTKAELKPGESLAPGHGRSIDSHLPGVSEHVYYTASQEHASGFRRVMGSGWKTYAVEPTGSGEPDPYDTVPNRSYRSTSPLVVRARL